MNKVICVDCDGVCMDLYPQWLLRYENLTGRHVKPSDIKSWDFGGLCLDKKILFGILDDPTLYDEVEEIRGAYSGIDCLRIMGHRVVFVTDSTPASAFGKMRWLKRHNFVKNFKDVVICADKSLIKGDFLVDDHLGNLEVFDGVRILFDQPHNRSLVEKGFVRLYNWNDVVQYILRTV